MRSDAELYLTFDVSRSMLAAGSPGGVTRLERARALGSDVHAALGDVPTGVATLTNRMMPLLFPTGDGRAVSAVIDHSVRLMQPRPERLTAARASSLATLGLAADRSYFNPGSRKRVLVVLQRPRHRPLQPQRARCSCCGGTGSSRSSFASPHRANGSSTRPGGRTRTRP